MLDENAVFVPGLDPSLVLAIQTQLSAFLPMPSSFS